MSEDPADARSTLALNTKFEDDFVSPLTAIRGALEILRDFPDLTQAEATRFVAAALEECARLEAGIEHLGASVYAAGKQSQAAPAAADPQIDERFAGRIRFSAGDGVADIDFSDFEFNSTRLVNAFYDAIEAAANATGQRWYFLVNNTDCRVWPEAWVAFAHRGKKVATNFALGTVRYAEGDDAAPFQTRAAAVEEVERLKARPSWR